MTHYRISGNGAIARNASAASETEAFAKAAGMATEHRCDVTIIRFELKSVDGRRREHFRPVARITWEKAAA